MDQSKRRGMMVILSSPSGAGKTSLSRALLSRDIHIRLSVSATTRPKRPGEIDGVHYFFMDVPTFESHINDHSFLEHAHVFGHSYGTPKKFVFDHLAMGQDILFDIDWQGTQQLSQKCPHDVVRIFILPPSLDELEKRLKSRAEDAPDVIDYRLAKAQDEMSHWAEYDYVVINHDFGACLDDITAIVHAERMKRARQLDLVNFIKGFG